MAPVFSPLVNDLSYRALIWLTYRLAATFALGLPLVLLAWAAIRCEAPMLRLLNQYWKVSSLMAIGLLLLTDARPLGFIVALVAPLLMAVSVWFWVDINEELNDLPIWRPLPLTIRLWRWALSGFALVNTVLVATAFPCLTADLGGAAAAGSCLQWLEAPKGLHGVIASVFGFLFGGQWTETVAAFIGYVALVAYLAGFLQWLLVRLPRHGRVAGGF